MGARPTEEIDSDQVHITLGSNGWTYITGLPCKTRFKLSSETARTLGNRLTAAAVDAQYAKEVFALAGQIQDDPREALVTVVRRYLTIRSDEPPEIRASRLRMIAMAMDAVDRLDLETERS